MSDLKNTEKSPLRNPFYDGLSRRDIHLSHIGEIKKSSDSIMFRDKPKTDEIIPVKNYCPSDYLNSIQSSIPSELISSKNYSKICNLASIFNKEITSFFGFETRLNKTDGCADYLFAISSKNGEREALLDLMKEKRLPYHLLQKPEWKRIQNFVEYWNDEHSILNKHVLGLWFEFDTAYSSNTQIPGLFVQIKPISKDENGDIEDYSWITKQLFPILTGRQLSVKNKNMIHRSIENLPTNSYLLFVAAMISRENASIRTTIKMNAEKIIPYLKSIGWTDESNGLESLLEEIKKVSTRIILHLDIGEKINPKIGLECSFAPDLYHHEKRWDDFFEYLVEKGICLPEKKDQVLSFMGTNLEKNKETFDLHSYDPIVKFDKNDVSSTTLVKYLSHIKIQYKSDGSIEAKAYPGVRLFAKK